MLPFSCHVSVLKLSGEPVKQLSTLLRTVSLQKQRGNPVNGILRAVGVRLQLLKHFSGNVTVSVSVRRCTQPAQELRLGAGNGGLATGTGQQVTPLVAKPPKSFYDVPNKAFRAAQGAKWKRNLEITSKKSFFPMQSTAALATLKQVCSDKIHTCLCSALLSLPGLQLKGSGQIFFRTDVP